MQKIVVNVMTGEQSIVNLTPEEIAAIPPPPPPVIPTVVSMKQARLALLQSGDLAAVNTAVAAMPQAAQIEWEYSAVVERNHTLVQGMKTLLGWTETKLDQLFTTASTLQ